MHVLEALRNAVCCARTSTWQLSTIWEGVSAWWSPRSAGSNCVRETAVNHACRPPVYQARYNVTRRCFLNGEVGSGLRKIPNRCPDNVRIMGRLIKVTQIDLSGKRRNPHGAKRTAKFNTTPQRQRSATACDCTALIGDSE